MKHGGKDGLGGAQFTEPRSAMPSFLRVGWVYPVLASNLVNGRNQCLERIKGLILGLDDP